MRMAYLLGKGVIPSKEHAIQSTKFIALRSQEQVLLSTCQLQVPCLPSFKDATWSLMEGPQQHPA